MTFARRVATPVMELAARGPIEGRVLGVGRRAAYLGFDGFVVVLAAEADPMMPNAVAATRPADWAPGATAVLERGRLEVAGTAVEWEEAAAWNPAVAFNAGAGAARVGARGRDLLAACGIDPAPEPAALAAALARAGIEVAESAREGVATLLRVLGEGDPEAAAPAVEALLGLGPGLTPEGDDLLAAAGASLVAFRTLVPPEERLGWRTVLAPPDLRARTTAISATLLELAVRGLAPEPALDLLDLASSRWRSARRELVRLGHSTGLLWAVGCGAAAMMLARAQGPILGRTEGSADAVRVDEGA